MANTNFIAGTLITHEWLNDTNDHVYNDTPIPPSTAVHTAAVISSLPTSNNPATTVQEQLDNIGSTTGASHVGFTQTGPNAVPYTVQDKERQQFSIKDWGALCDGTTDDTAAVLKSIADTGALARTLIIPGPTKISGPLTFGGLTELKFEAGGYFIGTGTELVQVQHQILSGPSPCFLNCSPRATTGMTVLAEWFGAVGDGVTNDRTAIQKAIDSLVNTGGVVQFDARTYAMSANLNIGTATPGSAGQNTVLQGKGANSTKLMTTDANAVGIQVLGAAGTPLQGVSIRDLSVTKSVLGTGGFGIYAQYTAILKLIDVTVSDYLIGINLLRATNTITERVLMQFSGTANNWRGLNLDGGGTGAGGNASSVFAKTYVDGSAATGTGGIGFYAFGAYVSDLIFDSCETASAPTGFLLDCTTSALNGNEDVQIINCRADQFSTRGIHIEGAGIAGSNDSMISIQGGWLNPKATGARTDSIFLNNCRGITISAGTQIYADANWANAYGVTAVNCTNITIEPSVLFRSQKYGVHMTTCSYSQIAGNFYSQSGRTATAHIYGIGCSRVMARGALFDGFATNAVVFDATSSGCGIVTNTANITNITTRYVNAGGGPIGAADGSTGLNSGV